MTATTVAGVDAWQRVGSDSFVPLRCSDADDAFTASMRQARWDDGLSLARVRTGRVLVQRTDALAARSTHDDVHLAVQVRATGTIRQHDRAVRMTPGTGVLYETHRPYVIDHRAAAPDLFVVHVQRRSLGLAAGDLERLAARPLSPARPAMRLLTSTLRELDAMPAANGRELDGLGGILVSLARLALQDALAVESVPGSDDDLLAAALVTIRANAGDPEFGVAELAASHHVSARHLYRAFAGAGLTPASAIRSERLARVQSLLAAATRAGASRAGGSADTADTGVDGPPPMTVEAIANASGFRDATTCIRAFKREFGVTPGSLLADG